ncbi:MAG TPA: hypothetical protein VF764_09005, partial [Steroidobacteraceae bacterium]
MSSWVYDDGGRKAAGFKGHCGDCVTRAVAIATGRPYAEVYAALSQGQSEQRRSKRARSRSARDGVSTTRAWFKRYMHSLGWTWVPTMAIGSGCRVHLKAEELPGGRIIARVSRHYVAVVDGVV